jgi:hypothetical protein
MKGNPIKLIMRKPPPFSGTFYLIFVPINHLIITAIART